MKRLLIALIIAASPTTRVAAAEKPRVLVMPRHSLIDRSLYRQSNRLLDLHSREDPKVKGDAHIL